MSYEIVKTLTPTVEDMTLIDWLWPGYLARGHLHILAGDPGCGKTQLVVNLASILSRKGRTFPCGIQNPEEIATLMWSTEDSFTDTLIPRLVGAQCDLSKFHYIHAVESSEGDTTAFNPSIHLDALKIKLATMENRPALLIIDPIANMITGEGNSNPQVRANLSPLVELAQKFKIAILGIHHLSKGTEGKPLQGRVNGSLAMTALARIVLIAGLDTRENAPTEYVFGKAKANITTSDEGFGYNLSPVMVSNSKFSTETTIVEWGEELSIPLSEALGSSNPRNSTAPTLSKIQQAADLIAEALKKEPMSWLFLCDICKKNNIGSRTARDARDRLKNGGLIQVEYATQWGRAAKWRLTQQMTDSPWAKKDVNYVNYVNYVTNDNLLNKDVTASLIPNKIVNIESVNDVIDVIDPLSDPHPKPVIYSLSSSDKLTYNEPFEPNDEVH
jgi:putative DNA primase/helicase